jgi:hypothetical protein
MKYILGNHYPSNKKEKIMSFEDEHGLGDKKKSVLKKYVGKGGVKPLRNSGWADMPNAQEAENARMNTDTFKSNGAIYKTNRDGTADRLKGPIGTPLKMPKPTRGPKNDAKQRVYRDMIDRALNKDKGPTIWSNKHII